MQIFISYSSHDRAVVEVLAQDLANALNTIAPAASNVVWFDQELVGGQDWWDTILRNIRQSDFVIFALSKKSIESDPCSLELSYAQAVKRQILPVLITDKEIKAWDLPAPVANIEYIDYSKQDKTAYQNLLSAVIQLTAAPEPLPDPLPEPPPIPLSPLTEISHRLRDPALSRQDQLDMFDQLRTHLAEPDQAKDARDLLLRLKSHPDVRKSIADDIDQLLRNTPEPKRQSATTAAVKPAAAVMSDPFHDVMQPTTERTPAPVINPSKPKSSWFGMNGRTIGLVIGVLYGLAISYNPFYGFDYETFVGSIVVFVLIGWGIDVLLRYLRRDGQKTT